MSAASQTSITTRAWVYRSSGKVSEVLKLESDYVLPSFPNLPILVRPKAISLNPVGYKTISEFPSLVTKKPAVSESDFSGVIEGGELDGTRFEVGDEVVGIVEASNQVRFGAGTLAELIRVTPTTMIKKPKNISFAEAAGIPLAGMTAYQLLTKGGKITAGQKVLINGATGGVGIFAVQIAKNLGCYVVGTCSEPSFEFVKGLGADEVVDYKRADLHQYLGQKFAKNSNGFDVVFDTIGVHSLYMASPAFVKPTGVFLSISAPANTVTSAVKSTLNIASAFLQPKWLGGVPVPFKLQGLSADKEMLTQLVQWADEGKLKSVVDSEYGFEDALEAYKKLQSGRAKGKVIVTF